MIMYGLVNQTGDLQRSLVRVSNAQAATHYHSPDRGAVERTGKQLREDTTNLRAPKPVSVDRLSQAIVRDEFGFVDDDPLFLQVSNVVLTCGEPHRASTLVG